MKLDELRKQLRDVRPDAGTERLAQVIRRLGYPKTAAAIGHNSQGESFDIQLIDDPHAPTTAEDRERLKRWVSASSIMSAEIDTRELRERLLRSDEELRKRDGYVDCSVCKRPDFVPDAPEEPYAYACRWCFEKARKP